MSDFSQKIDDESNNFENRDFAGESRLSQELDSQKIVADEESKALAGITQRFYSAVCHKFRSSLNIISFSNSLLRRYVDAQSNPPKHPYLDNIQGAVEQISTLLDTVVLLGQTETGQIKFQPQPTEVAILCRDLIITSEESAKLKQQSLDLTCQDNIGIANLDADILKPILTNILTNAIAYTPSGGKIEFKVLSQNENLIFQIEDTGIGILPVDRKRIFEPFYRGSNIAGTSGLGLGLAIAQNFVCLHGGKIALESQEKIGSTFAVIIPSMALTQSMSIESENQK
jgi:two-component system, OmpR family, phosphate regulon sensor histidine kinase PhoR